MKKFILLIGLFLCVSTISKAQNPRVTKKIGLGVQMLGPTIYGSGYLNYFVTPNHNIEVGAGLFGFYGGYRYYGGESDEYRIFTPYIGVHATHGGFLSMSGSSVFTGIYAPVGFQLMLRNGLSLSPELAYLGFKQKRKKFKHAAWPSLRLAFNF